MEERDIKIVETTLKFVQRDISEIKSTLNAISLSLSMSMTRDEAYKAFAQKNIEPELLRVRNVAEKSVFIIAVSLLGIIASLITLMVR